MGAGLLLLAAAGGCSSESEDPASQLTSTSTAPPTSCGSETGGSEVRFGIHYGLDPDELPILLGERGTERQAAAWQRIEERIDESLADPYTPSGEFVVNAGVAFDQTPEAVADSRAELLARLASQALSLPEGGEPDEGYHGQDGLATIHVVLPNDTGSTNIDRCRV